MVQNKNQQEDLPLALRGALELEVAHLHLTEVVMDSLIWKMLKGFTRDTNLFGA